ncbi:hypothetical protein [Anaerotignum sp. MB30-C6]|uniref:hypothetical protein n=1 Tax=Anaerotignum sp. MB30-C6 TaxID=3070814 RepID=UPI0027DC9B4D|nr:hypothetical protein [Anaerotignum sp. MB30-C6]WMI81857.1 hypothetical protein RBQ60_03770 [Anaerotignum sp. MB30-C6]WMI81957.1 hypothetical protein RBQ60_04285 [Anaerotignum sp. MB30-C6]
MMWLVENWILIVAAVAILAVVGSFVFKFYGLPTKKQVETIKEWLLYACMEAEKEFKGSKTGVLKLRYVYDLFVTRFPSVAKVVPFSMFSSWVLVVLEDMRMLLTENKAIREVVKGDAA